MVRSDTRADGDKVGEGVVVEARRADSSPAATTRQGRPVQRLHRVHPRLYLCPQLRLCTLSGTDELNSHMSILALYYVLCVFF